MNNFGNFSELSSKLHALTQTKAVSQYIDHLEILCQRVNVNQETGLHHFVNRFKPQLKDTLMQRQPHDCRTAMSYTELKDATSANNYSVLEQIKQLKNTNTQQEPLMNNLSYPHPVKLTQENAKLNTRIKQLEKMPLTQLYFHRITEI